MKRCHSAPSFPEAKMFNNMENLDWFVECACASLLSYDEVNVNVCVNEVPISTPSHGALDTHQTVLL